MTTILDRKIKIVGKPYYYLEQATVDNNASSAYLDNNVLKNYNLSDIHISYKFKLTKGNPASDYNQLLTFSTSSDGLKATFSNGYLNLYRGNTKYESNEYAFELNKWYVLNVTYIDNIVYFRICDENGDELVYSSWFLDGIDKRVARVTFYVGGRLGVLVSRDSKVTNAKGEVLADLSDLLWDWIESSGSTNAKFSAASEPVLDKLNIQITDTDSLPMHFTPDSGVDGFSYVTLKDIDNLEASNIKQGVSIASVIGTIVERNAQDITASLDASVSLPIVFGYSAGYNCLNSVTLNSIENLEASNIKKGVTIAGVAGSLEEKKLRTKYADIPSYYPLPYTINPDSNFNGMDKVIINTIGNLSADNIKSGVTIAGVKGTVVEKKAQAKTTSLAPDDSLPYVVEPSTGYNALDSVTITGITNLTAANIKKDVQIAGVTGTYEGSSSGGTRVVQASNNNNHAYPAGSKVYVFCLNNGTFHIQSPDSIKAPEYLRSCTIGVTNEAIDMGATGSVTLLTDIGTDYGLFRANANGEHGGFFVNRSQSAITSGDNYLCYLPGPAGTTTSDMQYAYIVPSVFDLSNWGNYSTLACFSLRRTGTYANSDFVLAGKLTNEDPAFITRVENDTDDVIRFYYKGEDSAGALLRVAFKNASGQWQYLDYTDHFLTNIGDNLRVEVRLQEGNNIKVFVNSSIVDDYQIDLTASVRAFALFNTVDQASYRFLLASSSSSGTPSLGCFCRVNSVNADLYLGAKYFD